MKRTAKGTFAVIGGVVAFLAVVVALLAISGVITIFGAEAESEVAKATRENRVETIVNDPDRSLADYERFYTDCNGIVALVQQLQAAQAELKDQERAYDAEADTFGQGQVNLQRLRSDITGLQQRTAEVAAGYNARAQQSASRGQFLAADLPFQINPPYEGLTCGGGIAP